MTQRAAPDADVIVVGAGPAGATLARLLAGAGVEVLLLDRATFPRPKPCGEYLSPGALRLLHEMGVGERVEAMAGARLRGFVVRAYGRTTMRGTFGAAPGWQGAPPYGLGIGRRALDAELVALAREAGACLLTATRVTEVVRGDGAVTGVRALCDGREVTLHARLVVGADGVAGVVGRRLGLIDPRPRLRRFALVAHVTGIAALTDYGEMHVGPAGYCGIAPLGAGVANVAMVLPAGRAPQIGARVADFFVETLAAFEGIGARLVDARLLGPVQRTGPLAYRARRLAVDGALLVGDAAAFYDPFTGQGIYKALRSAQLAAAVAVDALRADDVTRNRLRTYERAYRRAFRAVFAVEELVQHVLGHPAPLCRALQRLARHPQMADTLVGVTGDVLPPRRVLTPAFLLRLVM